MNLQQFDACKQFELSTSAILFDAFKDGYRAWLRSAADSCLEKMACFDWKNMCSQKTTVKPQMGLSENVVYPYTQWLMIIIPIKWL